MVMLFALFAIVSDAFSAGAVVGAGAAGAAFTSAAGFAGAGAGCLAAEPLP